MRQIKHQTLHGDEHAARVLLEELIVEAPQYLVGMGICLASVRKTVMATAMKSAAGIPFPDTSPNATTMRWSETRRTS